MDPPGLDAAPGISEIDEPVFVQARIAELAVEALHQRVLNRLPRLDESQPYTRSPVVGGRPDWGIGAI